MLSSVLFLWVSVTLTSSTVFFLLFFFFNIITMFQEKMWSVFVCFVRFLSLLSFNILNTRRSKIRPKISFLSNTQKHWIPTVAQHLAFSYSGKLAPTVLPSAFSAFFPLPGNSTGSTCTSRSQSTISKCGVKVRTT